MHRTQMSSLLLSAALGAFLLSGGAAWAEGLTPNQQMAHDIYKELVEIDATTATEKLSNEFWRGAAVIPVMSTGATDGAFLRNAGIPTYGHSGMAMEPGDAGRIRWLLDSQWRCVATKVVRFDPVV